VVRFAQAGGEVPVDQDGPRVDDTVTVTRAQLRGWARKVEGASELAGEIAGGTARDALHELATEIALVTVRRDAAERG